MKINGKDKFFCLYCILWLNKNPGLDLKNLLLEDNNYITQIITYLDIIILYYINKAILQLSILSSNKFIDLLIYGLKFYSNLLKSINYDNNVVAIIYKKHNLSYNAICF